jgi:TRAP-type mannitol/chloroaromatic compound transport system permease large subunit
MWETIAEAWAAGIRGGLIMVQFLVKTILSALIIATVSTLSRRFSLLGAIVISLPINSILAMIWLYVDTENVQKVIDLSYSILWIIIPSVVFFLVLPMLLKRNYGFYPAMALASLVMIGSYWLYVRLLTALGMKI